MNNYSDLSDLVTFEETTCRLNIDDRVFFQCCAGLVEARSNEFMKFILISYLSLICFGSFVVGQDTKPILPGAASVDNYVPLLQDKSVGLVVNHSSLVGNEHLVDVMIARKVDVTRIFAPEHGFRGKADDGAKIDDEVDTKTGLPIVSLYGKSRKPSPEQLEGVDVLVFDIQDVGARFYTFISTMHLVMEAAAEEDIEVIVLDRPNPHGYYIDGPVREPDFKSFIAMHPIPIVYGMTIGELALMINGEGWLDGGIECALTVITCQNYDHTMSYDLPVAPSPNLPNHRAVLLYPSLCLFEGTWVSVGRGTNTQFQVLGHPEFALGSYSFTPKPGPGSAHPLHEGTTLFGTSLVGMNAQDIMQWKRLNLHYLIGYHEYLAERTEFFNTAQKFDRLAGTSVLRKQLMDGMSEEEIRASWQPDIDAFKAKRKKYLLYPDFE